MTKKTQDRQEGMGYSEDFGTELGALFLSTCWGHRRHMAMPKQLSHSIILLSH